MNELKMHMTENNNSNNNNNNKMDASSVSPAPSEQQYSLKWNDFQSSILSSFRHLRDEEDFVDVTLACDTRSFTAHKVVLSACSPYFRKLLKANPCEHPIVILRDVRAEDVESLLRFMYNGEVHIGQEQLSDFLKTAQLLQVRGLADVTNPARQSHSQSLHHHNTSSSLTTPAVQELKASPVSIFKFAYYIKNILISIRFRSIKIRMQTSTSLPWELPDDNSQPPPQKRTKSSELYKRQHGISLSPERTIGREHISLQQQHALTRERVRDRRDSKESSRDRDRSLELRESLLGQALEGGPTLIVPSQVNRKYCK